MEAFAIKTTYKSNTLNVIIIKPDASYMIFDSDKTELFKHHLSDIFEPHSDMVSLYNINTMEVFLNSPFSVSLSVKHFTPNKFKFTINKHLINKFSVFYYIAAKIASCQLPVTCLRKQDFI